MTEIELLAIIETLKEFKGMLWKQMIKVYTDHKSLIQGALGLTLTVSTHGDYYLRSVVLKLCT